jgi:dolichol kinase
LFLGIALSLLLYLGKRYNSFNSIDSVERKTSGSFLLPISISILFILSKVGENDLYFVLPILILGISDPLAGMMGNFSNKKIVFMKKEFDKTYLGSLVFFLSSFIIVIIVLSYYSYEVINLILISILISILATLTEFLSSKGFDNLFVPHVVLLILYIVERSLFW